MGGRLVELNTESMEYRERGLRAAAHLSPGEVDRLDGGGLYRRRAIEEAGYFSDRNLHSYEEFDLAVRLRSLGWKLWRIPVDAVTHCGHDTPPYRLLMRRWRSGYVLRPRASWCAAARASRTCGWYCAACANCASTRPCWRGGWCCSASRSGRCRSLRCASSSSLAAAPCAVDAVAQALGMDARCLFRRVMVLLTPQAWCADCCAVAARRAGASTAASCTSRRGQLWNHATSTTHEAPVLPIALSRVGSAIDRRTVPHATDSRPTRHSNTY